jgi:hypothetical protein
MNKFTAMWALSSTQTHQAVAARKLFCLSTMNKANASRWAGFDTGMYVSFGKQKRDYPLPERIEAQQLFKFKASPRRSPDSLSYFPSLRFSQP